MADETISEKCETLYNKLNTFVASVISRDVTPKISNLNTEVWGSDTQTGSSRIDTLNTNFDNLNNSITTINIECSDYNPSIDSNITVTITVTDVYGDAISGKTVTVTASEGNFTQLNGSNITNASSVTGTTNSSGQFTLTYACSEWGLITFSANNTNNQINVDGWRKYLQTEVWLVEYNATTTRVTLASTVTVAVTTTEKEYGTAILNDWWLRPKRPMMFPTYNGNVIVIARGNNKLSHKTISGSVSMTSQYFQIEWSHQGLP